MARVSTLQKDWAKGMKRDGSRDTIAKGSAWNVVDWIPDLEAKLRKRGGWSYGSDDIAATTATASRIPVVDFAPFTTGAKLIGIDEEGVLHTINTSTNAVTAIGTAYASLQRPVLHSDLLIIPASDGTTVPDTYNGNVTVAALAGSPPAAKFAAVFKDRTVLANTLAEPTRVYFSDAANPSSWDTTAAWLSALSPVTGMASLPNALLIFQERVTARIRGSSPPPDPDMIVDDPIFNVGCTDARSIVVNGAYCVFANPLGVYLSNGTNLPEDLTQSCGIKRYWTTLLASYAAATWTLAGGVYQNKYVISVMNGATFVDAFMFDIDSRTVVRISNLPAIAFANAVTVGEELYFGSRAAARIGKFSTVFAPAAGVKNDADGTAVTPVLETALFRDRPGKKTWRSLYVTYDMRDAATDNPALTVSYVRNPEDAYTAISTTLAESANYTRARLPLRFSSDALAIKIAQTNASANTRIYDLEADVHDRELSRLPQ